jgi:hypothetical protein
MFNEIMEHLHKIEYLLANETTIQLDPPPLPPPIQYNTSLEDNTIISQPQETATSEPLPASSSNPSIESTTTESSLITPETVIQKYPKYLNTANMTRLAVKLAREAYFGTQLMKKSTVYGCTNKPPLPKEDVENLKKFLFSLFPEMRQCPWEFEEKWKRCTDAINHACAILRNK